MSLYARFVLQYPDFALNVDLTLPDTGIIGVFGRSGSGKTSLLRCIAGLEKAEGELSINGEVWQNEQRFLPIHQRPLAYVFQEASLFPHLSVQGNLDYARNRAGATRVAITYDTAIELFNIGHLLQRKPQQLSGGERQRVAIVRALLINPRLLLMDEPLASLDIAHKQEILPYLETLHRELSIPVLYVSHSLDEITRLADHLVVLEHGEVVANGALHDTLSRLDLPFHLGEDTGVVIDAQVIERDPRWHLMRVAFSTGEKSVSEKFTGENLVGEMPGGELWLRDSGENIGESVRVRILARDVSLALSQFRGSSILNRLPARIVEIVDDDDEAMALVRVQTATNTLLARVTKRSLDYLKLEAGASVWAQIKSVAIVR